MNEGEGVVVGCGTVRDRSTDAVLMARFGGRERAAAEELFSRFGPKIYGIGLLYFHDPNVAEAFVERAFVAIWRVSSRYPLSSVPLDTWVACQALGLVLAMSRSPADVERTRVEREGEAGAYGASAMRRSMEACA